MKKLILVIPLLLSACAYNSTTITAQGNVDCTATVNRPTEVNSLPITGNTVSGNEVPISAVP